MHAVILSIGDELALGQTVDTNTAWLAARLAAVGDSTRYHQTIPDDRPAIAEAIERAARAAPLVLVTGGLGPTEDDLTRDALADAMGVELVEDPAALATLEAFFAGRDRPMPQRNRVQAMHPRTTTTLPNDRGTAPGIQATLHHATVYVMPGVPREMTAMYEQSVEPGVVNAGHSTRGVILTNKVNTFGRGESDVAEALGPDLMDRARNPKVGTTVSDGYVCVRIRSEFPTPEHAGDQLDDTVRRVEEKLRDVAFGHGETTLAESLIRLLERRGQRLVVVESCTGGLLAKLLTDVPGSSMAFLGGWIVYSNTFKIDALDVPKAVIDEHGAVSEQTVRLLAENALRQSSPASVSLSISGVAGPGGGVEGKPVGTVWIGMGIRGEQDSTRIQTYASLLRLPGDRDAVRDRAAKSAMQMLRLHLLKE